MRNTLFALLVFAVAPALSAQVRMAGSDLLKGALAPEMEAFAKNNDMPITLTLEGSNLGMDRLIKGEADIGLVVFAPDEQKPEAPFVTMPVAYHTAVVAVRSAIPLTQLSFRQLAGVYGESEQATVRRWGDLGVSGAWGGRSILAVATSRQGGLALDLVRRNAMASGELKPTVNLIDDPAQAAVRISTEEGGMAILPVPPKDELGLKALLIARAAGETAYGPTPDNLHNGDYPLRLPLFIVFKKEDTAKLSILLRHLLSEDMVPVWQEAGVVALPVQARNQQIFDLETM